MSVARNTMSSPCSVVIDLWTCIRWDITYNKQVITEDVVNKFLILFKIASL